MRTAVLFTTHLVNDEVVERFNKLRDELPDGFQLYLFYDEARLKKGDVIRLAGDACLPHQNEGWRRFKQAGHYFKDKIPGNEDGLLFNAIDRLPGFDRFWYIEYDMVFSGHWSRLFDAFASSDADLLAVNITRHDDIPHWPLWKSIEAPADDSLPEQERIRVHLAISRLSRRLYDTLVPVYREGWAGHAEALLASLAARHGLVVEDIGGDGEFVADGNHNRFYRSTPTDNSLGPGTLVFRPPMTAPGDEPDMLWHPVKRVTRNDWDQDDHPLRRLMTRIRRRLGL